MFPRSLTGDLTEQPVMDPFEYISSLPSKGIRDLLISALNVWVDASPEVFPTIKSVIADVHNLSLM